MTGADKLKLDGIGGDSLLVHRAGAEDITGVKTFTVNQLLTATEADISDGTYPNQLTKRSYVRRAGYRYRMPVAPPGTDLATWDQWLNWPYPQVEMGPRTGAGAASRVLLIGTQPGNPSNVRNLAMQPLTPWTIPYQIGLARNGGLCKFSLRVWIYGNDAMTAARVYVNNVLQLPTPRVSYVTNTDTFDDATNNRIQCVREYFNLHGGYNGTGAVTAGEAEAMVTMLGLWSEAGANGRLFTYDWDADPDVAHSIAVDIWGVALSAGDGSGNSRGTVSLGAYDPSTAETFSFGVRTV
jgi:hypothetical protein